MRRWGCWRPAPRSRSSTAWTPSDYRNLLVWGAEDDPQLVDVKCVAAPPCQRTQGRVQLRVHTGMARAVGAPVVAETMQFVIGDGCDRRPAPAASSRPSTRSSSPRSTSGWRSTIPTMRRRRRAAAGRASTRRGERRAAGPLRRRVGRVPRREGVHLRRRLLIRRTSAPSTMCAHERSRADRAGARDLRRGRSCSERLAARNLTGPLVLLAAGSSSATPSWGIVSVDVESSTVHHLAEITLGAAAVRRRLDGAAGRGASGSPADRPPARASGCRCRSSPGTALAVARVPEPAAGAGRLDRGQPGADRRRPERRR